MSHIPRKGAKRAQNAPNAHNGRVLYLARQMDRKTPGIPGEFYVRDGAKKISICKSIERPFLQNKRSVSSIPPGEYDIERRTSGRYFRIYSERWGHDFVCELKPVPNRTGILIHAGRGICDSRGCLITTHTHKIKDGKLNAAGTSREAYCDLFTAIVKYDLRKIVIFAVREAK